MLPTSLKKSNQPAETMLVRSPMYHCQLYMAWPQGVPKLSRAALGKYVVVASKRHVIDDPAAADRTTLGLQPLVDPHLNRVDRGLDVGRAGDRRQRLAQDQVPRVVGKRQNPPVKLVRAKYLRTYS